MDAALGEQISVLELLFHFRTPLVEYGFHHIQRRCKPILYSPFVIYIVLAYNSLKYQSKIIGALRYFMVTMEDAQRENQAPKPAGYRLAPPWGWGEALVAVGCILCIVAATTLPWARASVTWRAILFETDVDLGIFSFRLLDNPWLAAALISVAVLCLAGLLWRRHAGNVAVAASLLLIGGSIVYVISLIEDAFDFLGFYKQLLEFARSLPMIGPLVESVIRERLSISAYPHVGVFVFIFATLLILAGGILMRRRARVHV